MSNPWLVLTNIDAIEQPFPTKKAASAFAKQWVEMHPRDEALVICRRKGDRDPQLLFSMKDGRVHTSRCGQRNRRSGQPVSRPKNAEIIEEAVRRLGYSAAKAKAVRLAVIASWTAALAAGESVETPVGIISVGAPRKEKRRYDPVRFRRRRELAVQQLYKRHPKGIHFKPNRKIFGNPKSQPVPPPVIRRQPAVVDRNPFWPTRSPNRRY